MLATRTMVIVCASLLAACGSLLGLDQGMALEGESDASTDATTVGVTPGGDEPANQASDDGPVTTTPDAPSPPDDSSAPPVQGRDSGSPGVDVGPDASCAPDLGWCDTHCGMGPDNCGGSRQCPPCTAGLSCGTGNVCVCQSDPNWCTGRCGQVNDNCGKAVDCGMCGPNPCKPESFTLACGVKQCGQATNNCNQTVNCGFLGVLSTCLNTSQVCLADGGCCTPNSAAACGNQCGTFVTDNCGRSVQCPTTCATGKVCYQSACCTPTDPCAGACGVTDTNNCGQTVQCGCAAGAECLPTNTCCVPQGCSANCVDSCGVPAASCCADAGPDSGPEGGPPEAGMDEAGPAEPDGGGPAD